MNAGGHRVVAALGLVFAGMLLTGCHAQGTFDVLSEERVAVDLTISGPDVNCPNGADALKLTVTTVYDEFGDPSCHVTGETQATYFSPFGIDISPAAEYIVMQVNLSGGRDSWPTADIQVRFPGAVAEASGGTIAGNTVRINDLGALSQGSGLRAVALGHPGLPTAQAAGLIGAGAGVGVTLAALGLFWFLRRRRTAGPEFVEATAFPDDAVPTAVTAGPAPVDPSPLSAEPPPDWSSASAGEAPAPSVDTSWFATPPEPDAPDAAADTSPEADMTEELATEAPTPDAGASDGAAPTPATSDAQHADAEPDATHDVWAPPDPHSFWKVGEDLPRR